MSCTLSSERRAFASSLPGLREPATAGGRPCGPQLLDPSRLPSQWQHCPESGALLGHCEVLGWRWVVGAWCISEPGD